MTIWDKIYKNYQKGGEAWATLNGDTIIEFNEFIKSTKFNFKNALEIGCGTGKYLIFLKKLGFKVSGVDSSKTAVEMTKKLLGDESKIILADMFDYAIPKNKYDLIFSISTIHHGIKNKVKKLIEEIYYSLISGGKIFITLPDKKVLWEEKWASFKERQEIEPDTYAPLLGPEKGLPHSYYDKEEVQKLFSNFKNVSIKLDTDSNGVWIITAEK